MTNILRMTLAASVAALTLTSTPAIAAPTGATPPATARARIVKPLTLEAQQNLDFGDIVVWGTGTASMDGAGNITCTATNLVCAATGTAAEYKVTGTNNQIVYITAPDVTLTNTVNPGTPLTLVLSAPASVTLPNSGSNGVNFNVGGSIAIDQATNEGVYNGNLAVTVDYQ